DLPWDAWPDLPWDAWPDLPWDAWPDLPWDLPFDLSWDAWPDLPWDLPFDLSWDMWFDIPWDLFPDLVQDVADADALDEADLEEGDLSPGLCGDGWRQEWEECDDGNRLALDGCSVDCRIEENYVCVGDRPSVCSCADGYQDNDGNGTCLADCATADPFCWDHGECDDSSGEAICVCYPYYGGADCADCVVYVDIQGELGDGSSWEAPLADIQEGLDLAAMRVEELGGFCEVWVADGTYPVYVSSPLDTIQLLPGVWLYGGFAGFEADRDERDWTANPAILDGGSWDATADHRVYHVVTGDSDVLLDGFIIQHGRANGDLVEQRNGAGLYIGAGTNVVVSHMVFRDNQAQDSGGGLHLDLGSSATVADSWFYRNSAGQQGGGMALFRAPLTRVLRCLFESNEAPHGGGLWIGDRFPTQTTVVNGCRFTGNNAIISDPYTSDGGGGLFVYWASVSVADCSFWNNTGNGGGGTYLDYYSDVSLRRTTFTGNSARTGGGLYVYNNSTVRADRSTWSSNQASHVGGALYVGAAAHAELTSSLLVANQAVNMGGAAFNWNSQLLLMGTTLLDNQDSQASLYNLDGTNGIDTCILWNDSPLECLDQNVEASTSLSFSNLPRGGHSCAAFWDGVGNISEDPQFRPLDTADSGTWEEIGYEPSTFLTHLQDNQASWEPDSLVGLVVQPFVDQPDQVFIIGNTTNRLTVLGDITWLGQEGQTYRLFNYRLSDQSPCVDSGNPNCGLAEDLDGNPRVGVCDMGAYELQPAQE
ncbi:MAG: right-handed parallel beta-helix repeat-containing protein, partial [Bradymonadales bacterium]|nr:right-handed parallel beta-helix repeat-containing protein [Bradymonadales bacterium]